MSEQPPGQVQAWEALMRARLATLEADHARVVVERARIEADAKRTETELAQLRKTLEELLRINVTAAPVAPPAPAYEQETVESEPPEAGQYAGLDLRDAIHKYLSFQRKEMKSPKEIWVALEKTGFKVLSGYPVHAVSAALRERANRRGDVFKAGGRWGAVGNFHTNFVRRVTKKHGGMGGKSAEEHGAATSAGMQRRKAAGLRVGAAPKMTPDQEREAEGMLRAKVSVTEVADHFGVTRATIYNRIGKERVKALRSGAAEDTETDTTTSHLRVVK